MAKHNFTNDTAGPKVVNGATGPVTLAPGESAEVEVSAAELKSAEATGWFAPAKADAKPSKAKDAD